MTTIILVLELISQLRNTHSLSLSSLTWGRLGGCWFALAVDLLDDQFADAVEAGGAGTGLDQVIIVCGQNVLQSVHARPSPPLLVLGFIESDANSCSK